MIPVYCYVLEFEFIFCLKSCYCTLILSSSIFSVAACVRNKIIWKSRYQSLYCLSTDTHSMLTCQFCNHCNHISHSLCVRGTKTSGSWVCGLMRLYQFHDWMSSVNTITYLFCWFKHNNMSVCMIITMCCTQCGDFHALIMCYSGCCECWLCMANALKKATKEFNE